jgi:ABC-type uncharacterized transport system permease subunit
MVYFAVFITAAIWWFLYRTKAGVSQTLRLNAPLSLAQPFVPER